MKLSAYARLSTEQRNPRSAQLDALSELEIVQLMNREEKRVLDALKRAERPIAAAASIVSRSLRASGRLIFAGAGTSGRLGVLEAAECPPTFNTLPQQVQALMAGGRSAVFRSKEGAEDSSREAVAAVRRLRLGDRDVLLGIAASGVTPYVQAAIQEAKRRGANTIFMTCNPKAVCPANIKIVLNTGAEVLAGSTRLKAGTACKLALNRITLAAMVHVGKVYGNRMVDLQPKSRKLVARAIHLIRTFEKLSESEAMRLFRQAKGNVKIAVIMARLGISYPEALQRLQRANGFLAKSLL